MPAFMIFTCTSVKSLSPITTKGKKEMLHNNKNVTADIISGLKSVLKLKAWIISNEFIKAELSKYVSMKHLLIILEDTCSYKNNAKY